MISPPDARSRAQSHFRSSEQRADAVRVEMEKERTARETKTARLKALRLQKEAEDKAEADRLAAEKGPEKARTVTQKAARRAGSARS